VENIRDTIRSYIVESRRLRKAPGDNDKLISGGILDSFSLVDLSLFLEQTFNVRPDDTELNADTMDTIEMIAAYVEAHR
jgi:acyl carrier protein